MRLDLIIPVFRDSVALARLLESRRLDDLDATVTVVFAEPDPEGESLVERHGASWLRAERPGRAQQMNHAADCVSGDGLLFLHADTLPPEGALDAIRQAIAAGAVGGAFARRFDSPSRWLKISARLADWRGRAFGVFLGDQGIFVRREVFEHLGGFDESARYEDLDFSLRLRKTGRTALLEPPVLSSARRFAAKGVLRQTLGDFVAGFSFVCAHRRTAEKETDSE
ncbi:MAG: glycosyltransferase family 2 protein [Opitutales bacterium]